MAITAEGKNNSGNKNFNKNCPFNLSMKEIASARDSDPIRGSVTTY
jgi:hypothetical protein